MRGPTIRWRGQVDHRCVFQPRASHGIRTAGVSVGIVWRPGLSLRRVGAVASTGRHGHVGISQEARAAAGVTPLLDYLPNVGVAGPEPTRRRSPLHRFREIEHELHAHIPAGVIDRLRLGTVHAPKIRRPQPRTCYGDQQLNGYSFLVSWFAWRPGILAFSEWE
jgi:hypothetical protein